MLKLERTIKKFPIRVYESVDKYIYRAYPRLCLEELRKKNSGGKELIGDPKKQLVGGFSTIISHASLIKNLIYSGES